MFRRPGDSSSSDTSDEETDYEEPSESHQDSVLSRINTLDSAAAGQPLQRPPLELRQNSAQNVRDLLLHSLLEERTIREVAEQLGKDPSDPDAQRLGRASYKEIARQISNNVDDAYASDDMQGHRTRANEGINKLTRSNLSKLEIIPESQALVARPGNDMPPLLPPQPALAFDIISGIPAPVELQLRGYPHLQTDRYIREFSELEIVGKGGYGKVFKAKHNLDGSFYAVKRIMVSPTKVARIQEHGPEELESMLQEVRSLARFDHNNIVRYHNAWLEFTTMPTETAAAPEVTLLREDRLLEGRANLPSSSPNFDMVHSELDSLTLDDPFARNDNSNGAGIIFEFSEHGLEENETHSESVHSSTKGALKLARSTKRRDSQASQTTIATISSTKSRMSAVEDVDEDEDVENIPRSHMPYSRELTTEVSDSMMSNSDAPHHLVQNRNLGPFLTLNVQMSLCETNLAAYLSSDKAVSVISPNAQHCFHPCVSLELLNSIVSGVEYLHSQGVVHRDLKPANVFLSLSTARYPPYGSVDVSGCKPCPKRDCLHMTPRIGDFGLVAVLSDSCTAPDTSAKPVGTEFYRPQTNSGINEKMDVFALGVVAFEMLHKFDTRMERIAALSELRRGIFPDGLAESIGYMGTEVQQLIGDMVQVDEQKRLSCDQVKCEVVKLVRLLKD